MNFNRPYLFIFTGVALLHIAGIAWTAKGAERPQFTAPPRKQVVVKTITLDPQKAESTAVTLPIVNEIAEAAAPLEPVIKPEVNLPELPPSSAPQIEQSSSTTTTITPSQPAPPVKKPQNAPKPTPKPTNALPPKTTPKSAAVKKLDPKPSPIATKKESIQPTPAPPATAQTTQQTTPSISPQRQALLAKAKASLSQVDKKSNAIAQTTNNPPTLDLHINLSGIQTSSGGSSGNALNYSSMVVGQIKNNLTLPEHGQVDVTLVIDKSGKVKDIKIKSSPSAKNRAYVETQLLKLQFPTFGLQLPDHEQQIFDLTLTNAR